MRHSFRAEDGQIAVTVAILMTVFIGVTAMVVDVGLLYDERRELQSAADAAALAGVRELPGDSGAARSAAERYADKNGATGVDKTVTFGGSAPLGVASIRPQCHTPPTATYTIHVRLEDPAAPLVFARALGIPTARVGARASAIVESPTAFSKGVMPIGVMSRDDGRNGPFGYAFGESVTLKVPAGSGSHGNYHFVALNGDSAHSGAPFILDSLRGGGVPNPVYAGREYYTKTGLNGANVTSALRSWITCSHDFDDIVDEPDDSGISHVVTPAGEPDGCHRIIIVPVIVNPDYPQNDPRRYNWTSHGSEKVEVLGFAEFFVDDIGTSGSDCTISGRFLRGIANTNVLQLGGISEFSPVHYRLIQ